MSEPLVLSNSRIKVWKNNHFDHYWKYVEKLQRKQKSSPLVRGSIIHECLEAYYEGRSWKKVLDKWEEEYYATTFAEEREELGDIPGLSREILENYMEYYDEVDSDLEVIATELHFQLPLTEGVELQGYIDAIMKDGQGRLWLWDHKTYKRMKDYSFFLYNPQSAIYLWAAQELGYEVEGFVWNVIRAAMPSKPSLTQKGELSKAKISTTPYTYTKGLIELGLDPEDYTEQIEQFTYEDFFQRQIIRLNQNTIDFIMEDIRETGKQILEYGEVWKDYNPDTAFPSSYREIWETQMQGGDVEYIIEQQFERRVYDDKTSEEDIK